MWDGGGRRGSCVLEKGMWNTHRHVQGSEELHGEDERLGPAHVRCDNQQVEQSIARWTL